MTIDRLPTARDMARWVELLAPSRQLAEVIASTDFVPKAMRNQPDVVTAAIMYGDELDIGPMQALQGIDVIEGRPRPSAELMRALIFRAGHSLAVHEMTGIRCRVSGLRAGRPENERVSIEWTIDMAKAAGLLGKSNWRSYPRAMLLARAMSDLARVLFPDVIKGMSYIAEDDSHMEALEGWQQPDGDDQRARSTGEQAQRVIRRRTTPSRAPALASVAPETGRHIADVPLPETPPDRPGETSGGAHRAEPAPDAPPEQPAEPEQPADGSVPPVDGRQLTALHTLLTKILGTATSPEQRRMVMGDLVGRELASSRDLTREEADVMRVNLARVTSGTADLLFDEPQGRWHVYTLPVEDPPDDDPWRYDPATGELLDDPGGSHD
jgi:hypothetical protein